MIDEASNENSHLSDHQLGEKLAAVIEQQASSSLPYSVVFNQLQDLLGDDTSLRGPLRDLLGRAAFRQLVGPERNTAPIGARDALLQDLGRTYNSHMVERLGVVINGCLDLPLTPLPTGIQQNTQRPLATSISKSISKRSTRPPIPAKPSNSASQRATAPGQPDRSDSSFLTKKRAVRIAIMSLLSSTAVIALTFNDQRPWREQTTIASKTQTAQTKISNSDTKPEALDQPSEVTKSKTEFPQSPLILKASSLQNGEIGELRGSSINVRFLIQSSANKNGLDWSQPVAEIYENGILVTSLRGAEGPDFGVRTAHVQIVDLDQSNDKEELLLSSFTGGAHCCGTLQVLTKNMQTQRWEEASIGPFDGGPLTAVDPLRDSRPLIKTRDNRFLYKFAPYAGSAAPAQFWRLEKGSFVDVSHDPKYKGIHSKNLTALEKAVSEFPYGDYNPNGVLAAYVATKALLGQVQSGWQTMLQHYDKKEEWGLKECRGEYDQKGKCRQEVVYSNYPEALLEFLLSAGYLTPGEVSELRSI